ncbi:MAG: hypothetical protein ABIQ88_18850 [Chitinophagaceae bacterium]
MEKNLPDATSTEQSAQVKTGTAVKLNIAEEIVMQDECGDSLWDKVLAQYDHFNNRKQHLPR